MPASIDGRTLGGCSSNVASAALPISVLAGSSAFASAAQALAGTNAGAARELPRRQMYSERTAEDVASQTEAAQAEGQRSESEGYGQILKSSALIAASTALNIGIGVVRTKAMALLLGPAGYGLLGLYGSIADVATSVAGVGITSSGVRQIAEAPHSERADRIARTTTVLRLTSIVLGLLGAVTLAIFAARASRVTFGEERYASGITLLSLAVFFRGVDGGQSALLQGTRRIAVLSKINVYSALLGAAIGIPVVYLWRDKG